MSAGGGSRTHMGVNPRVFETRASAIPPLRQRIRPLMRKAAEADCAWRIIVGPAAGINECASLWSRLRCRGARCGRGRAQRSGNFLPAADADRRAVALRAQTGTRILELGCLCAGIYPAARAPGLPAFRSPLGSGSGKPHRSATGAAPLRVLPNGSVTFRYIATGYGCPSGPPEEGAWRMVRIAERRRALLCGALAGYILRRYTGAGYSGPLSRDRPCGHKPHGLLPRACDVPAFPAVARLRRASRETCPRRRSGSGNPRCRATRSSCRDSCCVQAPAQI